MLFQNPVIETFLRAFSCFGQPFMMLKYFVERLKRMLEDGRTNQKSLSFVYDIMMKELFRTSVGTQVHGKIFETIKEFQDPLQKAGAKIKKGNKNVIKDLDQILGNLQNLRPNKPSVQVIQLIDREVIELK